MNGLHVEVLNKLIDVALWTVLEELSTYSMADLV